MRLLLRGATVYDGTGSAGEDVDVLVDGDRIAAVGAGLAVPEGTDEIDLDGLALSPGFIDIHTHYDAQVLWDPDLTPSSWHGVTTVLIGNCGFGIAPTRPADHDFIARTLENVEGMSVEALRSGIDWCFESFPEYLDALRARPTRLNVAAMIGHTPLRRFVMGDAASEREATDEEVAEMRRLVGDAMDAGAAGFATSKLITHVGADGVAVPSRFASTAEILELAQALGERGRGVIASTPGEGMTFAEFGMLSAETGRPLTWTALLTRKGQRGVATGLVDTTTSMGGQVWPQIACRPMVMQFTLADPFPFGMLPAFTDVLAAERDARRAVYSDPAWRDRARPEVETAWRGRWDQAVLAESVAHPELLGRTIDDIALERGDASPFDTLVDLGLADDLLARVTVVMLNDDEDEIADLLRDERTVLGLSDAGAHASQLCDACFSTHLLGHWVRELGALPLEKAVWRLTGQPASLLGLDDRGVIRAGAVADLVAFDPATVGAGSLERVRDLPAGADRLIAASTGVEHVWVAGVAIRTGGEDVPTSRPGTVISPTP